MTIDKQSEIIEAYKRGLEIEIKNKQGVWEPLTLTYPVDYQFNFQCYLYRVKRWRAKEGERYYFITVNMDISECYDDYCCADIYKYNAGNYFRTLEDAEHVRDQFREALGKFHEDE